MLTPDNIQIMNVAYAKRTPEDYARFAQAIAETLKAKSLDHEWKAYFVLKPVEFKLDNFAAMTGSLWIWFHAFADTRQAALVSREKLIRELGESLTSEGHVAKLEAAIPDT